MSGRDALVEQIAAACVHEASHCVAAVAAGGRIRGCWVARELVDIGVDDAGGVLYDGVSGGADRDATLAGSAGEALWRFGPYPTVRQFDEVWRRSGAADREAVLLADAADVSTGFRSGLGEIASTLRAVWEPVVVPLAARLAGTGTLMHSEVCEVLGVSMLGQGRFPVVASFGAVSAPARLAEHVERFARPLPGVHVRRATAAAVRERWAS
ncbi:hypothetical protein [Rhodococcus triatomae]|nr:hypothetical protein G419_16920 [Rhodococcus triatomae BKS 15-14]